MRPGDTFLVDLGCGKHLHVVLSHPFDTDRLIVVTMISTYDDDHKNATCILLPTDGHKFIKHSSYVAYHTAITIKESGLQKLKAKPMQAFSKEVTDRILKGANAINSDLPMECWCILDNQKLF